MLTISKQQARRFLLSKQLLLPPKTLNGKLGIRKVFEALRLIQYDPLNPCGRNPDLVLQSRVTNYHPEDYYEWLYQEKRGIECYDKELCIVPIEDFDFISHHHAKAMQRREFKQFVRKYQKEIEEVMLQIAKNPVTSQDIKSVIRIESGWGTSATFGRMLLEYLWRIGRVSVVKRDNGRKYYGLPDQHYSGNQITQTHYLKIEKEHIIRRLGAVGILPKSGSGSGWQGIGSAKVVSSLIKKLIRENILTEISVLESKRVYVVHSEDKVLLEKEISIESPKMSFIAPLDNLMWDRQMIEDFFDFSYRWEVYTPVVKRQFGYYVLPILYGDTFVGRIEPVLSKEKALTIKGLWKIGEWNDKTHKAYKMALEKFQEYLCAERIVSRTDETDR